MKRSFFVMLACLLCFKPLLAGEGSASSLSLTFDQCIEKALKANDQIHSASADWELSKAKLLEARPRAYPIIQYTDRFGPAPRDIDNMADSFFSGDITGFNQFKIEAGIPITTFGKINTAQQLAQVGIDASWFQRGKTTNEIIFKTYQVYQGITLARQLLGLAEQAQNTIKSKIETMQGDKMVDQLGVLKLKLVFFEVQRKVEEAQSKEKLAIAALKIQTGLPRDTNLNIVTTELAPVPYNLKKLDEYLEIARESRPEFKLLAFGLKAKSLKADLEKLNYLPNLGLGGFFDIGRAPYIRGNDDESNFSNPFNFTKAGIGFELKGTFDYVKTNAKIKQAQADLLKTTYDKKAAERGLELDIQQTYLDIQSNKSLLNKANEEIKTTRQIVFLTKSNLDVGIGEKKDYLDALQSYLVFQGRRLEAVYNYNVAVFELKKKIGVLEGEYRHLSIKKLGPEGAAN